MILRRIETGEKEPLHIRTFLARKFVIRIGRTDWTRSINMNSMFRASMFLVVLLVGCERGSSNYATLTDAVADGAVARGWVPPYLSDSASEIREVHDLDTNETWGEFRYANSGNSTPVQPPCEVTTLVEFPREPWVEWWPSDLTRGSQTDGGTYEYFSCGAMRYVTAREGLGYYWYLGYESSGAR